MIDLHEKYVESLTKKIEFVLDQVQLTNGSIYPHTIYNADGVIELSQEVQKKFKDYLESFDIINIIYDGFGEICRQDTQLSEYTGDLKAYDGLKNSLTSLTISRLKKLPYSYEVYLDLGHEKESIFERFDINEEFSLIYIKEDIESTEKKVLGPSNKIHANHYYLVGKLEGFSKESSTNERVLQFINKLKAIIYSGIINETFVRKTRFSWGGIPRTNLKVINNTVADGFISDYLLTSELSEFIANFSVSQKLKERPKGLLGILNQGEGDHLTWEQSNRDFHNYCLTLLDIANNPQKDQSLFSSVIWALKCRYTQDRSISFVQGCIALEALLSDQIEKQRLDQMLGDRFSYLLGRNNLQRKKYREDFKSIYELRSKIVHGSKNYFHSDENNKYYKLRDFIDMAIKKELLNYL